MTHAEHLIENALVLFDEKEYEEARECFLNSQINQKMAKETGINLEYIIEIAQYVKYVYCDKSLQSTKTVADSIRAMNDEELATLLDEAENAGYQDSSVAPNDKNGYPIDMLDWMKMEV